MMEIKSEGRDHIVASMQFMTQIVGRIVGSMDLIIVSLAEAEIFGRLCCSFRGGGLPNGGDDM